MGAGTGTGLDGNGYVPNGTTAPASRTAYGTNTGYANGGATYTTDTGGPYGAPTVEQVNGHTNGHANGFVEPKPRPLSRNF